MCCIYKAKKKCEELSEKIRKEADNSHGVRDEPDEKRRRCLGVRWYWGNGRKKTLQIRVWIYEFDWFFGKHEFCKYFTVKKTRRKSAGKNR